jgi:hypothetical protein
VKILRYAMTLGLVLLLSGCASEQHFAADMWPFGNPNAPRSNSETAQRALGKAPPVIPIPPQAGDVWPGAVQPVPTLNDIQKNANLPLGEGYTPSLPSPYPPGQDPGQASGASVDVTGGSLYSDQPGGTAQIPPPVPGDAR